ncbi:MAG: D-2-hydroxyacid dehydrogenase [Armatimonadota bacterium]|nr:D-2-hydroxyacid dehydrogenase [Armatimonadota bacterium]
MTEPLVVLVFANLDPRHIAQIEQVHPRVRVVTAPDLSRALEAAPAAEVMVGWNVPREAVQQARRLRWIHSTAAGVDQLLHPEVVQGEIIVTSSSGIHQPLVEHVFALLLALTRRLHIAIRNQTKGRWARREAVGDEVRGKTMGVLGLGTIGAEIAEKARAFGMHVIGTKRRPGPIPHVDRVYPPEGLPEVLAASDVVVIALPLTPDTRHLIGAGELRMMKPTAFLINIGRGAIVDEGALVRALREGWIAGAGLDVFEREPLPADSPLWQMEQVIITPHVSGAWPGYLDAAVPLFCDNLRRYLDGRPMRNLVDKSRGY